MTSCGWVGVTEVMELSLKPSVFLSFFKVEVKRPGTGTNGYN